MAKTKMYYTVCPISTEDLNWCPWLVFGHSKKDEVSEARVAYHFDAWLIQNRTIVDEDGHWERKFCKHMEELGYLAVVAVDGLNWGVTEENCR